MRRQTDGRSSRTAIRINYTAKLASNVAEVFPLRDDVVEGVTVQLPKHAVFLESTKRGIENH